MPGDRPMLRVPVSVCICFFLALCLFPARPGHAETCLAAPGGPVPAPEWRQAGACAFTENIGQVEDGRIMFHSSNGNAAFAQGSVYLYSTYPGDGGIALKHTVRLTFPGSWGVAPEAEGRLLWNSSFMLGPESGWVIGAGNYGGIVYRGLWDGIDLAYTLPDGNLKYEFRLAPGADPDDIRVKVEGAEGLRVTGSGLSIGLGRGYEITDSRPDVFYAPDPAERIQAGFRLSRPDVFGFSLGAYDASRPVVIDPLIYSTFLGGSGMDCIEAVAVGQDGCAYVTGRTESPDFPTTLGAYSDMSAPGTENVFVAKLGLNGDALVYSAMIGGESNDMSKAIAVDQAGCAYVAGYTMSHEFPTTQGALDRSYNGDTYDSFVIKLAPLGDSLAYSTYLGGSRVDCAECIAVDQAGCAYVAGNTWSFDFPLSADAVMRTFNGGTFGANDCFVTKLVPLGSSIAYSTFLGHSDYDYANAIAVDWNGYAYVTGQTHSAMFPVTSKAFDRTHNGGYDAFVTKLGQTGASFMYSTLLGGSSGDYGNGIAVGPWGAAYVAGSTASADFPTTPGAFSEQGRGGSDAFVTMLDRYGETVPYSTYIGGSGPDFGTGLYLDSGGCACLAGYTASSDFPTTDNAWDATYNGGTDAFVTRLSASGQSLLDSTYIGGGGNDYARAVAAGGTGFAHLAGETFSPSFPATAGAFDQGFNGDCDGFVTKIDLAPPVADPGPDMSVDEGKAAQFDAWRSHDNHAITDYTWSFSDHGIHVELHGMQAQHVFTVPGRYQITLNVTDASGHWVSAVMALTVLDITYPVADAGPDIITDEDVPVQFNASASWDNVGITNYTWSFTENFMPRQMFGPAPRHTFDKPGNYTVTLDIWDAAGNWARAALLVTVRDVTPPEARAGPDIRIYAGNETWLDGGASRDNVAIASYAWRFGDGTGDFSVSGAQVKHTFNLPGIYLVELTVTDVSGLAASDYALVTVLETVRPLADAGPDITLDEGQAATLDGSASADNAGVAEWRWTFDDGVNRVSILGETRAWIFTVPGTYAVQLNVTDAAGNWATDSLTVTVLDALPPTVLAGRNVLASPGDTVSFDGSGSRDSSGIAGYTWSFVYNGTETFLHGQSPSFTFWSPGSYDVTLTVSDPLGHEASAHVSVTISETNTEASGVWVDWYGWGLIVPACMMLTAALLVHLRRKSGVGGR